MAGDMAARWSEVPASVGTIGRRDLLVLSAGAVAALLLADDKQLHRALALAAPLSPAEVVRNLPKSRWDWAVELAVLHRIDADRPAALALLWAALELDLDPAQTWRNKPALRLYDLYAAASDAPGRTALAALVRDRSSHPALLARATLWSDASRPAYPRVWRTTGPDQQLLGIFLAQA